MDDTPHLLGAAVGMLVQTANTGEEERRNLHRQLDAKGKSTSELVADVLRLEKELEQTKLEVRLKRQNKFAANKQKFEGDNNENCNKSAQEQAPDKRGAPQGHTGWFRKTQTQYTTCGSMFWLGPVVHAARRTRSPSSRN